MNLNSLKLIFLEAKRSKPTGWQTLKQVEVNILSTTLMNKDLQVLKKISKRLIWTSTCNTCWKRGRFIEGRKRTKTKQAPMLRTLNSSTRKGSNSQQVLPTLMQGRISERGASSPRQPKSLRDLKNEYQYLFLILFNLSSLWCKINLRSEIPVTPEVSQLKVRNKFKKALFCWVYSIAFR